MESSISYFQYCFNSLITEMLAFFFFSLKDCTVPGKKKKGREMVVVHLSLSLAVVTR